MIIYLIFDQYDNIVDAFVSYSKAVEMQMDNPGFKMQPVTVSDMQTYKDSM